MKVKCINDDWSTRLDGSPMPEIIKNILLVGDNDIIPQKGKIYTVIGYDYTNLFNAYMLKERDTSLYGKKCTFDTRRFEVIDNSFTPNDVIIIDGDIYPCEKVQMYFCTWNLFKNINK